MVCSGFKFVTYPTLQVRGNPGTKAQVASFIQIKSLASWIQPPIYAMVLAFAIALSIQLSVLKLYDFGVVVASSSMTHTFKGFLEFTVYTS